MKRLQRLGAVASAMLGSSAAVCAAAAQSGEVVIRFDPVTSTVLRGDLFAVEIIADLNVPILGWGLDVLLSDTSVASFVETSLIGPAWSAAPTNDGDGLAGLPFPDSVSGPNVLLARIILRADEVGQTTIGVGSTPGDLSEGFAIDPTGFATIHVETGQINVLCPPVPPVISSCGPSPAPLVANSTCQAVAPDLTGQVMASDNCDTDLDVSQSPAAGTLLDLGETTVTMTVTDDDGLTDTCTLDVFVVDETPPVVLCPPGITVICDRFVDPGAPTVTDNCAVSTIVGVRSDGQPLTNLYPFGTTTVTWTASDTSGNTGVCTQDVTVLGQQPADVQVELEGVSTDLSRCITLTAYDCATAREYTVSAEIDFVGGLGSTTISLPCGDWDCMTAKDELHTLARTVPLVRLAGVLTGQFIDSDDLDAGDLTNDNRVDIFDFAVFLSQSGTMVDIDSTCANVPPPPYNADFNGDGLVNIGDYQAFVVRFFVLGDGLAACCPPGGMLPERMNLAESVSIRRLAAMIGAAAARRVDLDGNGMFDRRDVARYESVVRPVVKLSDIIRARQTDDW